MNSQYIVIIPARYASTRLPGKSLMEIGDKLLIQHVYDSAINSNATQVYIATDDRRIADSAKSFGANVIMTSVGHTSGTDRVTETVEILGCSDEDCIVNLQGDEVAMPPVIIDQVAGLLNSNPDAKMATLCEPVKNIEDVTDINVVKVVFNNKKSAMYFSRSIIPNNEKTGNNVFYRHIGIYAYRAGFLKTFSHWPVGNLEKIESLEQLRVLEQGEQISIDIACAETGIGVDTNKDLEKARKLITSNR